MADLDDLGRLAAARAAGEDAFLQLVAPLRKEVQAHCYRMVGSLQDAEDLVQETLLRAWRSLDHFEGRSSLRSWLYRIATNACLDLLEKRPRRSLPSMERPAADPSAPIEPPIEEPIWLEPYPDDALGEPALGPEAKYSLRQSIALAFLTALQILPPRQRAVLILREVLGWSAAEVGEALELSVPAVNSALQRARAAVEARAGAGREETRVQPDDRDSPRRQLLRRYVSAWEIGDVAALVAVLREDASLAMPPTPSWYQGRGPIAAWLSANLMAGDARGRFRLLETAANGAPAFALYQLDPGSGLYQARAIQVVQLEEDGLIREVHTFLNPALVRRFGLPETLER